MRFLRKKEKRDMKKFLVLGFAATAAVMFAVGCAKKEEAAPQAAPTTEAPAVVEETGTAMTATTGTETAPAESTETAPATSTGTSN
jgi:hypothetical protein